MKILFRISIVIILSFMIYSCKKDKPGTPIITTTDITEITQTTSVSGGEVTNEGVSPVVSRGVCWNISANPTIANSKTTESGGLGAFTSNLTQLTPNTMYYLRAYATNSVGTAYGNQVSFTTHPVEVSVLTTTEITSVTQTTAVSGGNITADNGGSVTARGVCWGTSSNPTIALSTKTTNNTGTGVFASSITGLTVSTTYYVRAYATNSAGTGYGNEISFTTNPPTLPVIATTEVSSITTTTAVSGGYVSSDGGVSATLRGICWSASPNPTTANNKVTDDGTGIGNFTGSLTGLVPNTTYYLRAYATNSAGTSYGNELIFKAYAVIDIEGNGYHSVIIGTQTWLVENLKTTKYNDGTAIPIVADNNTWITLSTPGYCWYNNDAGTYKATYGALYNWYSVSTGKLCPTGWHVPTDDELHALMLFLDVNAQLILIYESTIAGGKLKESGTTHWLSPNTGATNESGFTALPSGVRITDYGLFVGIGELFNWWSSTEYDSSREFYRNVGYSNSSVIRSRSVKTNGYSVRCLKD